MAAPSIGVLAALDPTVVGGGHGRPITGAGTGEALHLRGRHSLMTNGTGLAQLLGREMNVGMMRRAAGQIVLLVSGLGFPLTQAVIAHWGRRGALVAEGVSAGLLVRDGAMVRAGAPARLARLPRVLLWLELGSAASASVLGIAAIARPYQKLDGTLFGSLEALRRFCVGLLFGLHTYRFRIYLAPDHGLRPDAGDPGPKAEE